MGLRSRLRIAIGRAAAGQCVIEARDPILAPENLAIKHIARCAEDADSHGGLEIGLIGGGRRVAFRCGQHVLRSKTGLRQQRCDDRFIREIDLA